MAERSDGSFLADYKASLARMPAPDPLDVDGRWYGIAFCPSGPYPVTVNVEDGKGTASIEAALGDPRKTTPFHAEHHARQGGVAYRPETARLTFQADPDTQADGPGARGLTIELLLSPDRGDTALMTLSETYAGRARTCDQGVAGRADAGERIASFADRLATIRGDRRPVVQQACPEGYADWLQSHAASGSDALIEDRFADVFEAPYLSLSAERLLHTSAVLAGSCVSNDDRRSAIAQMRLAGALRDYKTYQALFDRQLRQEVARAWRRWTDQRLETGPILAPGMVTELLTVPHRFGLLDHPAMAGFEDQMRSLAEGNQATARNTEMAERIENARDDFRELVAIAMQARSRGDIDMAMVATGLDYYLAPAAKGYAERVEEPSDAAFLAAWLAEQRSGQCPAASGDVCEAAAAAIETRLSELARRFARAEHKAFAQLLDQYEDLERLAALVTFERDFRQRYGALASHPAFEDGVEDRAEAREDAQRAHEDALIAAAEAARTLPQMRDVRHRYFLDRELEQREALVAILDRRMQTSRPFSRISGGEYLNALYNQDFAQLRELDRQYLAGVSPLMRFGAAQLAELGPLMDAMTGKKPGSSAEGLARGMNNLTAVYAVIGTYLVQYEAAFEDCLKPGARTFTITRQTDYVTRDGFGNEIRRREGWTTRDSYRVNPEFAGQFDALFNTATGSAQAQLLDLFLNNAQISVLRLGTRTMMSKFDCDAPEVRQLEAGMLAYDREVRRRAGG